MATLPLRLWWLTVALLLWIPSTQTKEFTNQDIADALLSIVHMLRLSEDKLERHEYRTKALGDQLKRMLIALERKHRELEPYKKTISRLDERLINVEALLMRKEELEKTTETKTIETLDGIKKSIQTLTTTVEGMKIDRGTENNLTTNDDSVERRLNFTDSKIDGVKNPIESLERNINKDVNRSVCLEAASNTNPFEKHVRDAEKLLTKYEPKLNEYNGTKVPADIVQLNDVALADKIWCRNITEKMERQGKDISKIQKLLSEAEGVWKQLPKLADLQAGTNQTLDAVVKAADSVNRKSDESVSKVSLNLRELSDRLGATNEDIQQSLTTGNTLAERMYGDIALQAEIQSLSKNEKVILQTADNVIANKKRIEYGVQQLGDLLKMGNTVNATLSYKLHLIEENLSSKIDSDIAQVWRQIGIMHHQLQTNTAVLDKLTEHTDALTNSSTSEMKGVKGEINNISGRIMSISDNLDATLAQLRVATSEITRKMIPDPPSVNTKSGPELQRISAA